LTIKSKKKKKIPIPFLAKTRNPKETQDRRNTSGFLDRRKYL
jgi:hypothetical protein